MEGGHADPVEPAPMEGGASAGEGLARVDGVQGPVERPDMAHRSGVDAGTHRVDGVQHLGGAPVTDEMHGRLPGEAG